MITALRSLALLAACSVTACSTPPATGPNGESGPPAASAAPLPQATSVSAPIPPPIASAAPPPEPSAAPSATPSAAPEPPLPAVKVTNIGMHIGGGPNDDINKAPIRKSVEPHFDAFRRCFAKVDDLKKGGDFGVDLKIDKAGGKAQVSHPRTALKGKDFEECVVHTFEAIDFLKPKKGTTVVSYSLRFTP